MDNVKLFSRLEQICSCLEKEGWIFITRLNWSSGSIPIISVYYRHPNKSRIKIHVYEERIDMYRNKKLVKREYFPFPNATA